MVFLPSRVFPTAWNSAVQRNKSYPAPVASRLCPSTTLDHQNHHLRSAACSESNNHKLSWKLTCVVRCVVLAACESEGAVLDCETAPASAAHHQPSRPLSAPKLQWTGSAKSRPATTGLQHPSAKFRGCLRSLCSPFVFLQRCPAFFVQSQVTICFSSSFFFSEPLPCHHITHTVLHPPTRPPNRTHCCPVLLLLSSRQLKPGIFSS